MSDDPDELIEAALEFVRADKAHSESLRDVKSNREQCMTTARAYGLARAVLYDAAAFYQPSTKD